MTREPVVSGQFYSGSKERLIKEVGSMVGKPENRYNAIGAISPHAGYIYSGGVAGKVLGSIEPKKRYVIMGPNHTGLGAQFGLSESDAWKTPLGDAWIDKELAKEIVKHDKYIKYDDLSNVREHSIEVQLPFLQFIQNSFKFVPLVIGQASLGAYRELAKAIAGSIKQLKLEDDVTIIASSDMTHYESHQSVKEKDTSAIDAILELDEMKMVKRIEELDISMCGWAPAFIMIAAAKELGAKKARLMDYKTSGDVSGDYSSVVGYAGIIIERG